MKSSYLLRDHVIIISGIVSSTLWSYLDCKKTKKTKQNKKMYFLLFLFSLHNGLVFLLNIHISTCK